MPEESTTPDLVELTHRQCQAADGEEFDAIMADEQRVRSFFSWREARNAVGVGE